MIMIGGTTPTRALSNRFSMHVNDRRKAMKRRFTLRYSRKGAEDDGEKSLLHDNQLGQLAVVRSSEKRDSFRAGLPRSLLQTHDDRDCVAPIKLEEINFGPKLGTGEYANVFEIESFSLQSLDGAQDKTVEELEKRHMLKQFEKYRETKNARYALKHLKGEYFSSNDSDKCLQAVGDLALEAEFLASLSHPHIMKLRGLAFNGTSGFETGSTGYFLIIDRLFETLDDRIQRWAKSSSVVEKGRSQFAFRRRSIAFGVSVGKLRASSLQSSTIETEAEDTKLDERLSVALQIAAGLKYLHSHHIIFRDLKPANIGFDVRGDVKIFDFGLARVMPEDDGCPYTDKFEMSGAGSPRYMAPECLSGDSYNMKADVYSIAIVLWEMLSASRPYAFVKSLEQLIQHVVHKDERPEINDEWPVKINGMLESSFEKDINLRPKASLFYEIIRGELKKIRKGNARGLDDKWLQRRRSGESMRNLFASEEELKRLRPSIEKLDLEDHAEVDNEEVDESFHLSEYS